MREFYEPKAIFNCKEFIVSENNPYFKSIDGVLYSKDGTKLIQYPNKCTNTSFIIANSVIIIGESAFNDATKLTSITLTNNITTIESYAFSYCRGIKSIIIQKSVTSIGNSAFGSYSSDLKIYCEASSKPEGWSSYWHGYPITESNIVWGY